MELNDDEIIAYIKSMAVELLELKSGQVEKISLETPIAEGLKLDSVTLMVLITDLEGNYGFEFQPEDPERLFTFRDLVKIIKERATTSGGDYAA